MAANHSRGLTLEILLLLGCFTLLTNMDFMPTGAVEFEGSGLGAQHLVIIVFLIILGLFFVFGLREAFAAMRMSQVVLQPLVGRKDAPPIRPPPPPRAPIMHRMAALGAPSGKTSVWSVIRSGLKARMPGDVKSSVSRSALAAPVPAAPKPEKPVAVNCILPKAVIVPQAPAKPISAKESVKEVPKKEEKKTESQPSEPSWFSSMFAKKAPEASLDAELERVNRRIRQNLDSLYR